MTISIADDLRCIAKGEILSDRWSREVYSVDASHYAIKPSVVVCPVDKYDVEKVCKYCFSKNVPITAREQELACLDSPFQRTSLSILPNI